MLFKQTRIGKNGRLFTIYKFRTIPAGKTQSNVWGSFLRKTKLDELPQIINIIKGEMTWVGPRPDIPGYADQLIGEDRIILTVKPGITGLAQVKNIDMSTPALLAKTDRQMIDTLTLA